MCGCKNKKLKTFELELSNNKEKYVNKPKLPKKKKQNEIHSIN